jgi:hypothetical protein
MRSCHQGFARMSSSHEREMFQSSRTSWSSIVIEVDTLENSQRASGSLQDSQ